MHGIVASKFALTPQLMRVVLRVEGFKPTADTDQYVNCFFPSASGKEYPRRFTVRSWDEETGELTIDFAVHGEVGYAGRWALHAQAGDRLDFRGPAGGYSPHSDADAYLFVGDESAIPAIAASAEGVPPGRPVVVVLEVENAAGEVSIESPGALQVHWVHREGRHDSTLLASAVAALPAPTGRVSAFVHGEAEATRAVRRVLLSDGVVEPEYLSCSPYWRYGFDDEQWRAVKGAWVREVEKDLAR